MNYLLLAAAAAQAFNLNCTGTFNQTFSPIEQFSYTYRVDLAKKKWCSEECFRSFDFFEITPSQLTFEKVTIHVDVDERTFVVASVDRVTGEFRALFITRRKGWKPISGTWKGQCERAPFTGLPLETRKF